ncbi:SOS response-associated peptidase [soil metagenome]
MCGRYSLVAKPSKVEQRFHASFSQSPAELFYNAAPSQGLPVITASAPERLQLFSWGLLPFWAKDGIKTRRSINARAETIAEKPSFRQLIGRKRCLVVADGFYEWKLNQSAKEPYRLLLQEEGLFAFAGLWDEWVNKETGEVLATFAIITTEANELVRPIHDRMPVILPPEKEEQWLADSLTLEEHLALLRPFPAEGMKAYPVSTLVNFPKNNVSEVMAPLS